MITILFALAAAFSNALNMVTQHIASISDPGHNKGWRFVRYLAWNPLWLFGWVALGGSFVFQALALHNGQMSVVQPLLVTELVFALVLRRLWIRQQIRDHHLVGGRRDLWLAGALRGRVGANRGPRPADQLGLGRRHHRRRRRGGHPDPRRNARLARPPGGGSGGGDGDPLGARGHVHQGDDRHADPVRAHGDVHPLAGLRADRGGILAELSTRPRCTSAR